MMTTPRRCAAVLCAATFLTACDPAERMTAPAAVSSPAVTSSSPVAPPVGPLPPAIGPSATYVFRGPLQYPVSYFTVGSRFVLYDTGAFTLEYPPSAAKYFGAYERQDDVATFRFPGADGAVGTFKDNLLEIRFSERMQHSDFEDAVYRRAEQE